MTENAIAKEIVGAAFCIHTTLGPGIRIDTGFRADLVVEDKVIVEVKSVELLAPVHQKQLLTYLRLADKRLGLLINFHVALIKDGITRIVNGLEDRFSRQVAKPQRRVGISRHPLHGIFKGCVRSDVDVLAE
jgi:acetate kinase